MDFDSLKDDSEKTINLADGGEAEATPTSFDNLQEDSAPIVQPAMAAQSAVEQSPPHEVPPGASFDALQDDSESFGTPVEQGKAALEGLGQGLVGPLAPLAEKTAGVNPEAILARQEANPITHYAAEALGLGLGAMTGVGEAGLAAKIGSLGAKAAGLAEPISTVAKIGSGAVKAAIENMTIQGGDELSNLVLNKPGESVETALPNVGLAALIGGGVGGLFGAVHPLWEVSGGKELNGVLNSVVKRVGGIEGVVPNSVDDALVNSGIHLDPVVRAGMSDDTVVRQMFQTMQESSTGSGIKAQNALRQFRSDTSGAIAESLGKSADEIGAPISDYEAGDALRKSLTQDLKSTMDPISEQFEKIKEKYSGEELPHNTKSEIADKIGQLASNEGYTKAPSSAQAHLIQTTLKELPLQTTLEDLRQYQTILRDKTFGNPELSRVGNQLQKILRSGEDDVVIGAAGRGAPEALQQHADARAAYGKAMGAIDELNDRLHVGKFHGPAGFRAALKEMAPEDILRRLSPKNDARVIPLLQEVSPSTAEALKDYHLNQILKTASNRAGDGEIINSKSLFTQLDKLSPEMRDFLVPKPAQERIKAIQTLADSLPNRMNPSGTAKTIDNLWSKVPGSALGLATMVAGHNPAVGFLTGHMAKILGRDVPDSMRLSMLKFLGSAQPVDSQGFKAMVEFIDHAAKGESMLAKGTKNVFKGSEEVIPQTLEPTERDRVRLDRKLKLVQNSPEKMIGTGENLSAYMGDHGEALAQTTARAANYLNSVRPDNTPQNPLDSVLKITAAQQNAYNRALDIAEQPLIVLKNVKSGTVKPSDVVALKTMYPDLYNRMSDKLTNNMTDALSKGQKIPYKTRMGLSMFTGQPMDGTMTPMAIQAAQPMPPAPAGAPGGSPNKMKRGTAPLAKFSSAYLTSSQARQQARQKSD